MQSSPAATEASKSGETAQAALARDLYAFLAAVMRSGTGEIFRLVGDLDLSMTQIKTLHILDANVDELTLKDLSERLTVSMPAMSRSIDGLLHRGFVERREDDDEVARLAEALAPIVAREDVARCRPKEAR